MTLTLGYPCWWENNFNPFTTEIFTLIINPSHTILVLYECVRLFTKIETWLWHQKRHDLAWVIDKALLQHVIVFLWSNTPLLTSSLSRLLYKSAYFCYVYTVRFCITTNQNIAHIGYGILNEQITVHTCRPVYIHWHIKYSSFLAWMINWAGIIACDWASFSFVLRVKALV